VVNSADVVHAAAAWSSGVCDAKYAHERHKGQSNILTCENMNVRASRGCEILQWKNTKEAETVVHTAQRRRKKKKKNEYTLRQMSVNKKGVGKRTKNTRTTMDSKCAMNRRTAAAGRIGT
jgi:hypothetical protein